MAKDGTNRGGRRVRAGAKPEPLNEKLAAGRPATRLTAPAELDVFDLDGTDICLGLQLLGLVCLSSWHMHSAGLWRPRCRTLHPAGLVLHPPQLCIHRDHLWSVRECTLSAQTK